MVSISEQAFEFFFVQELSQKDTSEILCHEEGM